MLLEYVQEALKHAKYEIINNDSPYYGEVPELKGVWATDQTLEECRQNLADVVDGWLVVRLKKGLDIPLIGKCQIRPLEKVETHG